MPGVEENIEIAEVGAEDAPAAASANWPAAIQFDSLSGGKQEVQIELNGIKYRLRQTRHGKLILTT